MTPRELATLFRTERRRFARFSPAAAEARLFLARRPRGAAARAFAFVDVRQGDVTFYREALRLPRRHVLGLLRHELGHLSDPRVGRPGGEQRADDIAHAVTGHPIRYENFGRARAVQSVGRGEYPRPCWLHR